MKTTKRITKMASAALAGLMALQSVACAPSSNDGGPDDTTLRAADDLSDEELFREIMFPNAAAAERIPELARVYEFVGYESLDETQRQAIATTTDIIVANIEQIDPEFMHRFADGVTSGDVQLVDETMTEAQSMMSESMRMLSEDFEVLLNEDNVDTLRDRLTEDLGEEGANMMLELKTVDPEILALLVDSVHGHLDDIGLPATGQQIANAIDSQLNLALQLQGALDISSQLADSTDLSIQTSTQLVELTDVHASIDSIQQAQLQAAVEMQNAVDLDTTIAGQLDEQLSLNSQSANFVDLNVANASGTSTAFALAVAVAVVAVAVLVVAVVEVAHPIEGMSLVNGDDRELFRESMIANITEGYYRP